MHIFGGMPLSESQKEVKAKIRTSLWAFLTRQFLSSSLVYFLSFLLHPFIFDDGSLKMLYTKLPVKVLFHRNHHYQQFRWFSMNVFIAPKPELWSKLGLADFVDTYIFLILIRKRFPGTHTEVNFIFNKLSCCFLLVFLMMFYTGCDWLILSQSAAASPDPSALSPSVV